MAAQDPSPLRIAYDIHRLTAGGANGGIKVHHYEFLRSFVENHSHELQLHIFCQEEIVPELDFLSLKGDHQIHILGPRSTFEPRGATARLPPLHYWPDLPENLLILLEIDVLYAGFGFSPLFTPQVPQISLIVDVLHRSYPESLPTAEVKFRDEWYAREIARSTLIQTNSQFCKQQLVDEFGADPEKVFTIALPLHGRFNRVEMGPLPKQLQGLEHKYFLYPANYWPHKNHERLLVAFGIYLADIRNKDTHLVLTGNLNTESDLLVQLAQTLAIQYNVHFIGHTPQDQMKTVWEKSIALIFPSNYEGFGIPILEAMYFQKPIIASKIPPILEILQDEVYFFTPEDPHSISNAMKKATIPKALNFNYKSLISFDLHKEAESLNKWILQARQRKESQCASQ